MSSISERYLIIRRKNNSTSMRIDVHFRWKLQETVGEQVNRFVERLFESSANNCEAGAARHGGADTPRSAGLFRRHATRRRKTTRRMIRHRARNVRESARLHPRWDGHVYESAVAGRTRTRPGCTGVVPMHLDGNYPIGDADPLIHSSATLGTPRSRDTYESA